MKKWLVLMALVLWQTAPAQESMQSLLEKTLSSRSGETAPASPLTTALPLEAAIDPAEYMIGPGDLFLIRAGGGNMDNIETAVSPEGDLIIPSVGTIPVADLSLAAAREKIIARMTVKYVSKELGVHLLRPRLFRVSVTGAVMNPGVVEVQGGSRAVTAIELAGGLSQPVKLQSRTQQVTVQTPLSQESSMQSTRINPTVDVNVVAGSRRNIMIKRRSGASVRVDMQKFALTGDLASNPYLRDGDVIYVPNEELLTGRVHILGALKNPDDFEYAPSDRVIDLLEMAHGFTTDADSSEIELVRFNGAGMETNRRLLPLPAEDPARRQESLNFPLMADDRLFVRAQPKFHEMRNVEITGEVVYPGIYALPDGSTRLTQVIQRAGGLTPEASLKNAYIQRRAQEDVLDPEFERLKKMLVADMTENERDYFKIKSRERVGGMGVDFAALFQKGDKSQDVILRDRDLIHIPAQEQTVKVTGQVINPGLYPFRPDMPLKHYLAEAGGYNWNARKSRVRIIRSQTGEWEKPTDDTIIQVGDTIFIPEKPERDWWREARDFITVITQLAMIYSVINNAGK